MKVQNAHNQEERVDSSFLSIKINVDILFSAVITD